MDHHLPCVVMAHYVEELPVSCVAVNNRAAAREAVEYLIRLGHREIATITGHLRTPIGLERLDGYLDALKAHQLPVKPHFIEHGDYTGPSARPAAKRLLERRDRPTAMFAASDAMAVAVMDVAGELRLRVPEDLSVIGFDDSAVAQAAKVPLTTVWQPLSRVGELATEILAKSMAQRRRTPVKKWLETKLVERQSCRQTWLEHT